jgi:hypothetical protein
MVAGADLRFSQISHNLLIRVPALQSLSASASVGNCHVLLSFVLDLYTTVGLTFDTKRISLRIHHHGCGLGPSGSP